MVLRFSPINRHPNAPGMVQVALLPSARGITPSVKSPPWLVPIFSLGWTLKAQGLSRARLMSAPRTQTAHPDSRIENAVKINRMKSPELIPVPWIICVIPGAQRPIGRIELARLGRIGDRTD